MDSLHPMSSQGLPSPVISDGRVLEITTTTGCFVGCTYCPQNKFAVRQRAVSHARHLRLEDFKKCLARVPAAVDISFSGYSEPWLNPDCTEMVEHAHASGHGIRISTTLVGMNERDLRRLQALDFRVFLVHVFDDGTYMDGGLVGRHYIDLMRQLIDTDISSLLFIVMGEIHPDLVEIVPYKALIRSRPLRGGVNPEIVGTRQPIAGALTCPDERQHRNVLLPNGDVTLCCMDFERRHVLGNLLRDSYTDLFEGPAFCEIAERMNGKDGFLACRMCEFAN
ncbi:radical SAM/SPASM domain-containing protein [Bradyrhizobium sp. CCGE-LA001]|uniref:radical SAM/SPASM domain-containing protein n=1 Tax=Bradyrhizobium sp. CCGE-LA001 TaxID=1223566 RepID=UPI000745C415|nr:radical SAM/SPASM domain-containing protein [Bradyrhizobium sp. CCGE-LA001]AMA60039.1 radical SAM protein [Bradyrhizobium sp. CCGE-LA001]